MDIAKVLTIAGSDSSGGAGIQADLKTMSALDIYGMSVITAVTSQNTTGVREVFTLPADSVFSQGAAVFEDIFPDAVKIGMLANADIIRTVARLLEIYSPRNVVLDTVFISTSGCALIEKSAVQVLKEELILKADIITPNVLEAEELAQMCICNRADMEYAAKRIAQWYEGAVLLKGGHITGDKAADLLYYNGEKIWYEADFVNNSNTHGTGCTLSSAIASYLAYGYPLPDAVGAAKEYLTGAIRFGLDIGKGRGPLYHGWKNR